MFNYLIQRCFQTRNSIVFCVYISYLAFPIYYAKKVLMVRAQTPNDIFIRSFLYIKLKENHVQHFPSHTWSIYILIRRRQLHQPESSNMGLQGRESAIIQRKLAGLVFLLPFFSRFLLSPSLLLLLLFYGQLGGKSPNRFRLVLGPEQQCKAGRLDS